MSRFSQVEDPANNEDLKVLYQDMLDNGFGDKTPIHWLTSQSSRPDILAGTWAFSKGMLLQGELPMMVKQMIATTISARNNCNYCQDLHGNTLGMLCNLRSRFRSIRQRSTAMTSRHCETMALRRVKCSKSWR
jgi:hypothetical protein